MRILLVTIAVLLCFSRGQTQETLLSDPYLRHGKLDNGFTYYIREVKGDSIGETYISLVGKAGKWLERRDQWGLAHLMEHMNALAPTSANFDDAFGLSGSRTVEGIDFINPGRRICTNDDSVEYGIGFKQIDKKYWKALLPRLRALAFDSLMLRNLRHEHLVNTLGRKTILEEMGGHIQYVAILDSIYTEILGITSKPKEELSQFAVMNNIKTFKLSSLENFYRDWYRPDMQALVIVGAIDDVDWLENQVKATFSELKVPEDSISINKNALSDYFKGTAVSLPGNKRVVGIKNNAILDEVFALNLLRPIRYPIINRKQTLKQYRKDLISHLYLFALNYRLNSLSKEYGSPFANRRVNGRIEDYDGKNNVEWLSIGIPLIENIDIGSNIEKVIVELERLSRYGFTISELNWAKKGLLEKQKKQREYNGNLGELRQNYIKHFVRGNMTISPNYKQSILQNLLSTIEVGEINEYAQEWWEVPDKVLSFMLSKDNQVTGIPTDKEFIRLLTSLKKKKILPREETSFQTPQVLMSASEIRRLDVDVPYTEEGKKSGITTLKLKNGISLLLNPLANTEEVVIEGFRETGAISYKDDMDYLTALQSPNLVIHSGAGDWNKFQLEDYKKANAIEFSLGVTDTLVNIHGKGPKEKVENLLQLLYLYFEKPNITPEAFEDWKSIESKRISRIQNDKKSNGLSIYDLATKEILGTSQESKPHLFSKEKLSRIDRNLAYLYYRQLFSTDSLVLILTGDFNLEEIRPMLLRYLGKLPVRQSTGIMVSKKNNNKQIMPKQGLNETFYSHKSSYCNSLNYVGKITSIKDMVSLELFTVLFNEKLVKEFKSQGFYTIKSFGLRYYDADYYRFFMTDCHKKDRLETIQETIRLAMNYVKSLQIPKREFSELKAAYQAELEKIIANEGKEGFSKGMAVYIREQMLRYKGPQTLAREKLIWLEKITLEDVKGMADKYLSEESISIIRKHPVIEPTELK